MTARQGKIINERARCKKELDRNRSSLAQPIEIDARNIDSSPEFGIHVFLQLGTNKQKK